MAVLHRLTRSLARYAKFALVTGRLGGDDDDDDDDDGGKRKLVQVEAITAPLGPGGIQSPFSMIWESLTSFFSS